MVTMLLFDAKKSNDLNLWQRRLKGVAKPRLAGSANRLNGGSSSCGGGGGLEVV